MADRDYFEIIPVESIALSIAVLPCLFCSLGKSFQRTLHALVRDEAMLFGRSNVRHISSRKSVRIYFRGGVFVVYSLHIETIDVQLLSQSLF